MGPAPTYRDGESLTMRLPLVSVTLISAAVLAYEILLTRLFSIIQWHHFAYMIISLALLGFGASGSFIAILQKRLLARFHFHYPLNLSLFGLTSLLCFLIAQRIPLNPEEMLWEPRHFVRLAAAYLLLSVPFFFAANGLGLALARFRDGIPRVYAADLLGAGLGSLGVLTLLFLVFPVPALQMIAAAGLIAAAVATIELATRPRVIALGLGIAAALPFAVPQPWLALQLSPYKGLPQTLRVPGARVIVERSSPLGLVSVVESTKVPLRYAPGLSVRASAGPPEQLGLFTDGDSLTVVTRGDGEGMEYLGQATSAAPFGMANPRSVLVLGAGGGADVLQSLALGAERVDAVELNGQIIDLVADTYDAFSGHLYTRPNVSTHVAEARGFIAGTSRRYDLIALPLLDSIGSAGLYALNESYLYTVEAFDLLLSRLAPGGYLAVTRWVRNPPRDALKLFATAVETLESAGIDNPGSRLALIRSWQTTTMLVKNGRITRDEISALRGFCKGLSFDTAYYPGIQESETNRYNVLSEPLYYQGALALLGADREAYSTRYKFNIRPATDNRPYFFHFFKWSALPEILGLRDGGGLPLLESGYLVLIATLAQAFVLSLLLILLPVVLSLSPSRSAGARTGINGKVLMYFMALGIGFLLLEIAFIQRFVLFLHHPVYAVATVLSGFLVFAGLGSSLSRRIAERFGEAEAVRLAVIAIIVLGIVYATALGTVFAMLASMAFWLKVVTAWAIIAPLALFMGIPFPTGLTTLGNIAPALIPWAWAINGCASVLSAVLGTVLAVHLGFNWVVTVALVAYAGATLAFGRAGKFGNPP